MQLLASCAVFLALALATPVRAAAQAPRDRLVVTSDWLAEHLNDPRLVLLHVGEERDYAAEHIPGARYVGHHDISHPASHSGDALILELPEPAALQSTLRRLGVSNHSRIVVYWGSEWVTPTARVIFTLDWAGLGDRTALLDGGIDAWKHAGHAVTDAPAPAPPGNVTVHPRRELLVDAAWVQSHVGAERHALVDGRARAFYDGVRDDQGKLGHIPGAGSVPWTELIDESLLLRNAEQLRRAFAAGGVAPGDTVVAYCHIGQYATLVLFAARTLGHEVKLYDGAFQDWARRGLPVVAGGGR
jgi:thiosulfate/3-mercaptopyruvate sulfurtransferase